MGDKRIIAVAGATGLQGGSVVKYLLDDGKCKVRAFTRDPNSQQAKAMMQKGVEVVKVDIRNKEEVKMGLQGVYGYFASTQFWEDLAGNEKEIGTLNVEAAKECGVRHFIWSTLSNVREASKGQLDAPHFSDKAEVDKVARAASFEYTTFVGPAFYYTNFPSWFAPQKDANGVLVFKLPLGPGNHLAAYDVEDTGEAVVTAFNYPDEWNGKYIPLMGENLPAEDYVKIFAQVTGKPVRYEVIPPEIYSGNVFPGARELTDIFGWINEYFGKGWDLSLAKKAAPNLKSWEQWLRKTGWKGEGMPHVA